MDSIYDVEDASGILSPGIVLFREIVERNVDAMIELAGDPGRLRPHCKTHKMAEVTRLEVARGITKHKAATFAEAEMLAEAGAESVFLAYNLVGPNVGRGVEFRRRFPHVHFAVTADHPEPVAALGAVMSSAGQMIDVLLDVDVGQNRTGTPAGDAAADLYALIDRTDGLAVGGLHVYDGHNHQESLAERQEAVDGCWSQASRLRDRLVADGFVVPRIVAGGTPTFAVWAAVDDPAIECSPGTCVLHDVGYGGHFPEQPFTPAALLLTRVVSRPTADRVTLDLGNKAVASDPPAGQRVHFPDLPDAEAVVHNEEHLVLKTPRAGEFQPGDVLFGIPTHVCPTSALHESATVVEAGLVVGTWEVTARKRRLTI